MQRAGAPRSLRGVVVSSAASTNQLQLTQKRSSWVPYWYNGAHDWTIPPNCDATDRQTNFLKNHKFITKSRKQWDYNRVDENVSNFSEFRKMADRPDFGGMRENNYPTHNASMKNPPNVKKLYEYFDEYTQPGSDKKLMAAMAVKEQWDAENAYYPGESWEHNRPAFRSAPKEIINKLTTYRLNDYLRRMPEIASSQRTRSWNPAWPPPGYKLPEFGTKREFVFGSEDPALVAEVERWYWYKMWAEANIRYGMTEALTMVLVIYMFWWGAKNHMSNWNWFAVTSNNWYPGSRFIHTFGEPVGEGGKFWWQEDLKTWPTQITYHTLREMRFGYINHLKRKEARKEAESSL